MKEESKVTEEKKKAAKAAPSKAPAEPESPKGDKAASPEAAATAAPVVTKKAKKIRKGVAVADIHIQSTFNNTIVTISDLSGNTLCWSTSGSRGFKGSKRSTPFAAQLAAEDASNKAKDMGVRSAHVYVSGPGAGRESALRAIQHAGIKVILMRDVTPIPHNGCRPPKRRRV